MARHNFSPGSVIGMITLIHHDGFINYKNTNNPVWICRCNICGSVERLPAWKITKRAAGNRACSACTRGNCIICSAPVPESRPRSNTCSESCQSVKKRDKYLRYYIKKSVNPDHNKIRYALQKNREAANPALAYRRKNKGIITKKNYRQRPDVIERNREYQRKRYRELRDVIIAQRKAFFASLSTEEQEILRDKHRAYDREYKRRYREWLIANPDEHAKFIEKNRERERQKSLSDMLRQAQKIITRIDDDTDTEK